MLGNGWEMGNGWELWEIGGKLSELWEIGGKLLELRRFNDSHVGVVGADDLRVVGVVRVGVVGADDLRVVGVVRVGDLRAVGVVDDHPFAIRVGVVEGGSAADLAVEQFSAPRKLGNMIATVQVLSLAAVRVVAEKHLPSLCGPNNQPTDYTADVVQKRHVYVRVGKLRDCARGEWHFRTEDGNVFVKKKIVPYITLLKVG